MDPLNCISYAYLVMLHYYLEKENDRDRVIVAQLGRLFNGNQEVKSLTPIYYGKVWWQLWYNNLVVQKVI